MAKIDRKELLDACKAVMAGVSQKDIIPQATNFIFMDDRVYSYNDEVAVNYPIIVGFEGAVPAKEFMALISKVTAKEISLTAKDGEIRLVGSKAKAGLRLEQRIILPLEDVGMPEEWNDLPDNFCEAVAFCLFSASKDESKAILMNLHIEGQYITSCDNYRITRYDLGEDAFPETMLLPASAARDIIEHKPTEYACTEGWLHFRNDDEVTFSCRTYNEEYPDFTPFLKCDGEEIELPATLPEILDRADVLADEERISVILEKDLITIATENDAGWFEESVETTYKGRDVEFDIQPQFLTQIMKFKGKATVGENVLMFESDTFQHCVQLLTPKKK